MAVIPTVALFGCERGEAFLSRATADAQTRFPGARIVQRSANAHAGDVEPFVAVYTEARFTRVIDDHRAKGIPVFTETELEAPHGHAAQEAGQSSQVDDAQEGDRPAQEVTEPPRRGPGRPRKVA